MTYFVDVLARAYERFEHGASADRSSGSKQDRVRKYVTENAPQIFKIADISAALPAISDPTIRLVLDELKRDGRIRRERTGRAARWLRTLGRGRRNSVHSVCTVASVESRLRRSGGV